MLPSSAQPHAVIPSAPASSRLFLAAELINGKKHFIGVRNGELAVPEAIHGQKPCFWQSDLGVKLICHSEWSASWGEFIGGTRIPWQVKPKFRDFFHFCDLHSSLWVVEFDCECYSGNSRFKCVLVDVCFFVSLIVVSQLKIFLFNATFWNGSTYFLKWF